MLQSVSAVQHKPRDQQVPKLTGMLKLAKVRKWQGSSDSNRGPSVLETDALTN